MLFILLIIQIFITKACAQQNEAVPNSPKITEVRCAKGNRWETAVLKWKPMGENGAPILNYTIQYTTTGVWENVTVPATKQFYLIRILPWRNFTFRVIARNKIGESGYSNFSHVCSLPDVPHKNPGNVTVKYVEPNTLLITWTPLPEIDHNADGFYYIIYWKPSDSQNWNCEKIWNWRSNEFRIELANVASSDGYKLKLVAANQEGKANITAEENFVEIIPDFTEAKLALGGVLIFCLILAMVFCIYIWKKREASKRDTFGN